MMLVLISAASCTDPAAAPFDRYVHGDTDCDGELTITDATEIQRLLVESPSEIFDRFASDFDSDGSITILDASCIQRRIAEMDSDLLVHYSQMNSYTEEYLSMGDYADDDHSYSEMSGHIPEYRKMSSRPAPYLLDIPANGTLYLREGERPVSYQVEKGVFEIRNMTPGEEVTYLLKDEDGKRTKAGLLYPTGRVRMINGGGKTFNIRDLGGWDCDGGTLKYGLIFRGCELSGDNYNVNINDEQISLFRDFLGIRDEIDLRADSEVDGVDNLYGTDDDIRDSVLGSKVTYIRYPVVPYAVGVNLGNSYQTKIYAALIKRVSRDIKDGKPCYIHCMAGADRTGTLCALIEAICGVSLSDIEKDYELTSLSPEAPRLRTSNEWKALVEYLNSFPGESFRDRVICYAVRAGVSTDEIKALRDGMIHKKI